MRVICDLMGADRGAEELLRGVCAAAELTDAAFTLVGDRTAMIRAAAHIGADIDRFTLVHAAQTVTMEDDPLSAVRVKKESSMSIALGLLSQGEGDVTVSCGNTGALFTGATLLVRKIRGIQRAAIATVLPFSPPLLVLDAGANVEVSAEYLEQFAVMGSIYAGRLFRLEHPRVGLLNNGTESHKGTHVVREAYERLSVCSHIRFIGNVEANMLAEDVCDVLVCDGFSGNILLKSIEGMADMVMGRLRGMLTANPVARLSSMALYKPLRGLRHDLDATEYGGSPLLGISRPVIKAHGASNANAYKNAVLKGIYYAQTGVIQSISEEADLFCELRQHRRGLSQDAGWNDK